MDLNRCGEVGVFELIASIFPSDIKERQRQRDEAMLKAATHKRLMDEQAKVNKQSSKDKSGEVGEGAVDGGGGSMMLVSVSRRGSERGMSHMESLTQSQSKGSIDFLDKAGMLSRSGAYFPSSSNLNIGTSEHPSAYS